ncbi:hypothetical protein M426DRAFT_14034 [Hypoxylon sp. CI-4A]|nr:hypothetical protein M426DRAFT_14034 [Hypoxylon sp. CI-4A]
MSTQAKTLPQPSGRTFGVEFEFLVPFLFEGQPDPHEKFASQLAPVIRIPGEMVGVSNATKLSGIDSARVYFRTRPIVEGYILDTLKAHGLPTVSAEDDSYSGWAVKDDISVNSYTPGYNWVSIELVSPVARASPEAFAAIRYTLDMLCSTYRITVNNTCGLHVHVGDGDEHMPKEHISRIMGLLWAVDPLLACLHPLGRRGSSYSPSIRTGSYLSQGRGIKDMMDEYPGGSGVCHRYIGRETRHGEHPTSWRAANQGDHHVSAFEKTRELGRFDPFNGLTEESSTSEAPQQESGSVESNLDLEIQDRMKRYEADPASRHARTAHTPTNTRNVSHIEPRDTIPPSAIRQLEDIGTFAGVREIFASPSSCTIQWLLGAILSRPNYSISPYACYNLPGSLFPKTIEFREAAGTTSGRWAEIWARICVGLVDFAIHAPVHEYMDVIFKVDRAASGGAPYDVIDLLNQFGLASEALFAEQRIKEQSKYLGVKFIPNEEAER